MGDNRRFKLVADFIDRNFPLPKYKRILDVAGGVKGFLTRELLKRGYDSTNIDLRASAGGIRESYKKEMGVDYDLVVGLHPDSATEEICKTSLAKPIVLIPCCKFWEGVESHGSPNQAETVRRFFKRAKIIYRETVLKMRGKNVVFWT